MPQTSLTAEEVYDSLTGFDEIAIAQHFGRTVTELATTDPSMLGRALAFVINRRDGSSDDEARNFALGLTTKELNTGFFAEVSEDEDEAGKDERSEEQPESSLSSVS